MPLLQMIMGWPAITASLVLAVAGILQRRPSLVVPAGILSIGFAWYFSMTPRFRAMGLLIPLLLFGAAWAVSRRLAWVAWVLLAPILIFAGWLAWVVLTQ